MASDKPAILVIPGSWHMPVHYEGLIKQLELQGHQTLSMALPTVDVSDASISDLAHPDLSGPRPSNPWPDMYADATAIRQEISKLVNSGKRVILVAHSYGGLPTSEALVPELCLKEREQEGKKGGVIGIFAIASFFLPPGMSTVMAVGGDPLPATPEQPSGLHVVVDAHNNLFNDLPGPEQVYWTSLLRPQPWVVHETPLKNPGHLNVPCAFLKTRLDVISPYEKQELIVAGARQMGAKITEYEINGGHDAFIGQPEACAQYIVEFAYKCS